MKKELNEKKLYLRGSGASSYQCFTPNGVECSKLTFDTRLFLRDYVGNTTAESR